MRSTQRIIRFGDQPLSDLRWRLQIIAMTGFSRMPARLLALLLVAISTWPVAASNLSTQSERDFITARLPGITAYAKQPAIITALQHAASTPFSLNQTLQQDKNWLHDTALRQRIAAHALSKQFKALAEDQDNAISEILLIDRYGRLVASYPEASDYYQGDETKFIRPATEQQYFIDRADWDDSSGSVAIQIAMPVFDRQEFIGVLVESLEVDLRILTRMQVE